MVSFEVYVNTSYLELLKSGMDTKEKLNENGNNGEIIHKLEWVVFFRRGDKAYTNAYFVS